MHAALKGAQVPGSRESDAQLLVRRACDRHGAAVLEGLHLWPELAERRASAVRAGVVLLAAVPLEDYILERICQRERDRK